MKSDFLKVFHLSNFQRPEEEKLYRISCMMFFVHMFFLISPKSSHEPSWCVYTGGVSDAFFSYLSFACLKKYASILINPGVYTGHITVCVSPDLKPIFAL